MILFRSSGLISLASATIKSNKNEKDKKQSRNKRR